MNNLAYDDDIFAETKTELIDGKIVMMSPRPRISHNRACTAISREFSSYLKGKPCEAFSDGVDIFLDEKNRFIPDVMIVCNRDIIHDDGIYGAPDLVVEVLSPTTARFDRGKKKDAYEKAGVKEYWIVDIFSRFVEVYLLSENGRFELDNIYYYYDNEEKAKINALPENSKDKVEIYDEIKVSLYDDLIIALDDIFERIH
ncbi:Uma2 family endonuclease [Megamonas hypermegale]|uniref:Uma2 family endonuclease n=1 Tax=Megamonas hypermegale TaxID=158847 RepID=UPI00320A167C